MGVSSDTFMQVPPFGPYVECGLSADFLLLLFFFFFFEKTGTPRRTGAFTDVLYSVINSSVRDVVCHTQSADRV